MAKAKSVFVCNECGYESNGWLGKCPECLSWNSFFEQKIVVAKGKNAERSGIANNDGIAPKAIPLSEIQSANEKRCVTDIPELDRVLGGGIVRGSMILVGGDPGIGKSTLIMQVCDNYANNEKVLYVSGEESDKQIKLRADRLGSINDKNANNLLLFAETLFENIEMVIAETNPSLVIIDSIQTMFVEYLDSIPGSVSQVKEVTARLMRIAKGKGISVIIVGHVTKEGMLAGPRVLEHMVDCVLYFEGERHMNYRVLRVVKNRFGSTNEIGIFEMTGRGLIEVSNPSEIFISERCVGEPGTVIISNVEGSRPMLIEVQALLAQTSYGIPKRTSRGFDNNRLAMLLAVLEKKAGLHISNCDVYLNVVGGLVVSEPASDLGILVAMASSFKNVSVDSQSIFIGEVGLTGEIRRVNYLDKRLNEAARLGFKKCYVPKGNLSGFDRETVKYINQEINVIEASNIAELIKGL